MAEEFLPLNEAERDSDTSWYTSLAAGIASGIIKVPEGVVSLAAELIDLGADTNTAADVEKFFDKLNPFEEVAENRAIGKLTEALVQVGVPGTIGFKAANKVARNLTAKALKAKRQNAYATFAETGSRGKLTNALNKARDFNKAAKVPRFAVGVMGGAAGEVFVADVEKIGTFGDMFDGGPTELNRDETLGRDEAARKLANRLKFGSESLALTPFVYGIGKSAKLLANRSKDLAYSDSKFARFLDKYIRAPFSPRGALTDELFTEQNVKEALKSVDTNRAREIVDNLTREIDFIYPDAEKVLGKSGKEEKEKFLKLLNDALFEGDIRSPINPNAVDNILSVMNKTNLNLERRQAIIGGINNAREEFTKLVGILDNNLEGTTLSKGAKELQSLLKDRVVGWVGATYKIFENQSGLFKLSQRYTPTDESIEAAEKFFREQIAKQNGDVNFNPNGTKYIREARNQVQSILRDISKVKKPKPLDTNEYIIRTMEGRPGADFVKQVIENTKLPPKEIRQLLGAVEDPRYSIFNAITNLSLVSRNASFLSRVATKNDEVQRAGGRGFFWDADPTTGRTAKQVGEDALRSKTTGIELVPVDELVKELPGAGKIVNPLQGKFTTKEIMEALKNANNITSGLQGFVRGEGKEGAEAVVSWMYRNLLLFPKGVSQLSKTVFSIPTHLRNMLSAFGFSGANGILFENPKLVAKAFKEGIDTSSLLKLGPGNAKAQAAYRELLELGVVNSQVQIGDLKALLTDVRLGEQAANIDSILNPFMRRMRKIKEFAQGKYVAEDDTFKITNYVVELDRLKKSAVLQGLDVTDEVVLRGLKQQAADIVKNTVPNYSFVGSAVRTARLLPIGNFMSFPSEMIRTTTNIAQQGLKELRHIPAPGVKIKGSNIGLTVTEILEDGTEQVVKNNALTRGTYGTGLKRISGMAAFTTGVPIALTEAASAMYDVSKDELQSLRRFVPEWSKNSTLIPIKDDDGNLRYVDFSHSNAYDIIGRPFRTLLNNVQDGQQNDQQLLTSFVKGVDEAGSEIMNPFISESIWTEAAADIVVRGGRTKEGRLLYTDQTSAGDKAAIRFMHLGNALAPSYKQYVRLAQAASESPTKRGELLDVGPEILGFMGLRPIKVDPLQSMGFKIAGYQRGIREARREFTGGFFGLLRGGPIDQDDVVRRYIASNRSRFNVQKNMFNDINAAEILGVSRNNLNKQFKDRQISDDTFVKLAQGKFDPYFPSASIIERFQEIARNLGDPDAFKLSQPELNRLRREFATLLDLRGGFAEGGPVGTNVRVDSLIKNLFPILSSLKDKMMNLSLVGNFNIDVPDFAKPKIEAPLPPTPTVNPAVLQPVQQASLTQTGLTPTEQALLSPEEQAIKLRQRGLA
jgi:hypothetical protein